MRGWPLSIERTVGRALPRAGQQLVTRIRANASGRPGPRVITGNYRRSWSTRLVSGALAVVVGTNAPQARRLEYGFSGTDSLGRRYNQPPFAHVEPAVRQERAPIIRILEDAVSEAGRL
jgi:hypothetical protein